MEDLRYQKQRLSEKELIQHMKEFALKPKFSTGMWCFYPGGGRFHEAYSSQGSVSDILDLVTQLKDQKVINQDFCLEAHYPNEINYDNIDQYRALTKSTGIRLISVIPNLFYDKRFEFGSLSNPNNEIRDFAIQRTIESFQLNKDLKTDFAIVWPGIDGYENPIGTHFTRMWDLFEEGLAQAMDEVPGTRVAIEPKPYEPRGNNIYRNTANGILMTRNVEQKLKNSINQKALLDQQALVTLNPEVGHVLMGHEELAYAFASILTEGRLAHTHWNSQPLGNYDQDLNVGVLGIDQAIAALIVLKMHGYRHYFGLDINPERIPIEKALILNMNAINAFVEKVNKQIDYDRLIEVMFNPSEKRGVAEDVVIRALAGQSKDLLRF